MNNWEAFPKPVKPEGITDEEWQWYLNTDPRKHPELRDKVEAALGWQKDDIADAREIAERVLGAVSLHDTIMEAQPILPKGHVPEENLFRYRNLARISKQLKSLGDTIGPNDMEDSTILWRLAKKYRDKANELRVDIPREEEQHGADPEV